MDLAPLKIRSKLEIARLKSIPRDFPTCPPATDTLWVLGEGDPFHSWTEVELPRYELVKYLILKGGQFPLIDSKQRFCREVSSFLSDLMD